MRKWTHETYVLENMPMENGKENLALPDEIFGPNEPKSYAKYFIKYCDIVDCDVEVASEKTVNTLEINTKKPLKLSFSLPSFSYDIYINKG